jgi:glutamate-1-semialdehyde aminotransferase
MTVPSQFNVASWSTLAGSAVSTMVTGKGAVDFKVLVEQIEQLTAMAKSKIAQIRSKGSAMSIGDMFDLQMAMNKLQQFSEMSTSVISAMNTSINSMARNVKG